MYLLGATISFIAEALSTILNIYLYIVIGAVLISWVRPDPYNPIVRFLHQLTEPVLYQVRKRLPASFFRTSIDFSPLIVLLLILFINRVLLSSLYHYGQRIKFL